MKTLKRVSTQEPACSWIKGREKWNKFKKIKIKNKTKWRKKITILKNEKKSFFLLLCMSTTKHHLSFFLLLIPPCHVISHTHITNQPSLNRRKTVVSPCSPSSSFFSSKRWAVFYHDILFLLKFLFYFFFFFWLRNLWIWMIGSDSCIYNMRCRGCEWRGEGGGGFSDRCRLM